MSKIVNEEILVTQPAISGLTGILPLSKQPIYRLDIYRLRLYLCNEVWGSALYLEHQKLILLIHSAPRGSL